MAAPSHDERSRRDKDVKEFGPQISYSRRYQDDVYEYRYFESK